VNQRKKPAAESHAHGERGTISVMFQPRCWFAGA